MNFLPLCAYERLRNNLIPTLRPIAQDKLQRKSHPFFETIENYKKATVLLDVAHTHLSTIQSLKSTLQESFLRKL
jgi:hypothetical protein